MPNTQSFFVHTVLVRPTYPKNIGQAARATANCGFGKLHIIDPQCELGSEMRKGAAGSQVTLDEAKVYKTWEEFNEQNPQSYRIALSRRLGRHRKLFSLEEGSHLYIKNSIEKLSERSVKAHEVYLIFGPEADGLSQTDLEHTHMCCNLSLYGDFKSLNLAHAVLLSQHTVHRIFLDHIQSVKAEKKNALPEPLVNESSEITTKTPKSIYNNDSLFPDQLFSKWLVEIGMQQDPNRTNAFETLRRLILRAFPSQSEILMFEKALRKALEAKTE